MQLQTVIRALECTEESYASEDRFPDYGDIINTEEDDLDGMLNPKKGRYAIVQEQYYNTYPVPHSILYIPKKYNDYIRRRLPY